MTLGRPVLATKRTDCTEEVETINGITWWRHNCNRCSHVWYSNIKYPKICNNSDYWIPKDSNQEIWEIKRQVSDKLKKITNRKEKKEQREKLLEKVATKITPCTSPLLWNVTKVNNQ